MAKTYLDQLVEYPAKIIKKISEDKYCVGLLVNKGFNEVSEDNFDEVLDKFIYDYQYVDETIRETSAYVWVEMEVNHVANKQIKGIRVYVTVSCHKGFMQLDSAIHKGVIGNRRDNLVRYIDRLLNDSYIAGIGNLKLQAVKTISPTNGFVAREIIYEVPDFNIVDLSDEV